METLRINERQKQSRHDARRIRRMGKVPGVLYGEDVRNMLFEISEMDLNKEILKNGEHGVITFDIGGTEHKALLKEVQRDPVDKKVIHIDLEEIKSDAVIQTEVPILFAHEQKGVKSGGILQKEKDRLKIECKADRLPKFISVDLSDLKLGDVYRISDIEIAEDITFMEDKNTVIASVTSGNTNGPSLEETTTPPKEIHDKDK